MLQKIIQKILSSFLFLRVFKRYKSRSALMRIKTAQAYVHGVRKLRLLFVGVLFISVSFVLLINGLALIQTALFKYSMWSNETKFTVALWMGGIEFLAAIGIFYFLLRENAWARFFGVDEVIHYVLRDKSHPKK